MKYIFDIDRTLFDSNRWLADNGGVYTPELVHPDSWQAESGAAYLYDDVLSWFAAHEDGDIHILTAMKRSLSPTAQAYQTAKVAHLGIVEHVASVTLMAGDKGSYVAALANGQPAVFVDDCLSHHQSVRAVAPQVTCCLMVRPGQSEPATPVPAGIHLVRSLAEVDAIVATQ